MNFKRALLIFFVWFLPIGAQSQEPATRKIEPTSKRGASTDIERRNFVELFRALEANPLGPGAKDNRGALIAFTIEVPDIHVTVC
ncbi:MAG: hypothetical protein HYX26_05255, partial [Acidobacteriales bacterium]|nr:hypothetical protein [Terriglobales bacterium]